MPSKYKTIIVLLIHLLRKGVYMDTMEKFFIYMKKLRREINLMTSTLSHTTRFLKLY